MMRVLWEEWRSGNEFSSFQVLPLLAVVVVLSLLVTQLHPGSVLLILTLAGLVGGVFSGTQRWNRLLGRDWVGLEGTPAASYAVGKVVGFLALLSVWVAFLLPPLFLGALVWGLPWQAAASALAWVFAGALLAQGVGHLVTWTTSELSRLMGFLLAFLLVTLTFQAGGLRGLNPLWQVWHQFQDPTATFDAAAWATLLAITAALWTVVVLVLARTEGRR